MTVASELAAGGPPLPRPVAWRTPALVGVWAFTAAFVAGRLAVTPAAPASRGSPFDWLLVLLLAAAGLAALAGDPPRRGRQRAGWRLVAAAWLVSAVGYALVAGVPSGRWGWLGRVGDWAYFSYYPLMVAGMFSLAAVPAGVGRRLRAVLDVLVVAGASQLLVWHLVVSHVPLATLQSAARDLASNSLGELATLAAAAWLLASMQKQPSTSARLLGAAVLLGAVADLSALQTELLPTPAGRQAADAALAASAALVATAGLLDVGQRASGRALAPGLAGSVLGHLPTLALGLVLGLLARESWTQGYAGAVMGVGASVLAGLALVAHGLARREADREAELGAEQAERLAQSHRLAALGHLAGATAHDFNNLVSALGGLVEELRERRGVDELADELAAVTARAREACRRLLDMGRVVGRPAPVELGQVLNGLGPVLRRLLPGRIRVELVLGGDATVLVERGQLELAVVNLVVNARDAIPDQGTVTLSALAAAVVPGDAAALRGVPPGRYGLLVVTDTGAGMDAATLSRAREPRFTTKPDGSGLGLALADDAVRAAGGCMLVQSALGRGTAVSLFLPAAAPAAPTP